MWNNKNHFFFLRFLLKIYQQRIFLVNKCANNTINAIILSSIHASSWYGQILHSWYIPKDSETNTRLRNHLRRRLWMYQHSFTEKNRFVIKLSSSMSNNQPSDNILLYLVHLIVSKLSWKKATPQISFWKNFRLTNANERGLSDLSSIVNESVVYYNKTI